MAKNVKSITDALNKKPTGEMPDTGETLPVAAASGSDFLGCMREDAELLDMIVEEAMRRRRVGAWCPRSEDFAALEAMAEETGQSLNELLDQALHLLLERRHRHEPSLDKGSSYGDV